MRDAQGRPFAVEVTVPRLGDEYPGRRWKILGNAIGGDGRVGFLEAKTGREPEPGEWSPSQPVGRAETSRHAWPADYPAKARELHAAGLSCPKVAAELDVPWTTVKSWLWPAGHEPRKQRRKATA